MAQLLDLKTKNAAVTADEFFLQIADLLLQDLSRADGVIIAGRNLLAETLFEVYRAGARDEVLKNALR